MDKKISVVIPAYNEEQYIGGALAALCKQTFSRDMFEIIVVDNASTDHTSDIARTYGADKIIFEPCKGTNRARQTGLECSEGEIVAFLDADCIPPEQWLETIYKKLHEKKSAYVAIAGAYIFNWNENESTMAIMEKFYQWVVMPTINEVMGKIFKRGGVIIGGNFASFRENFLKMSGFDTSYTFFGDDASIARRLGELGRIQFDPRLTVISSTRRFKREGLLRTNIEYAKNYFKVMFSHQ
ncbi:glycosyltransferase [Candidatus Uhrbacteria bacterium]|nr:glycosyltransferase [Candidatus Uhrbacteria bacterium]